MSILMCVSVISLATCVTSIFETTYINYQLTSIILFKCIHIQLVLSQIYLWFKQEGVNEQ